MSSLLQLNPLVCSKEILHQIRQTNLRIFQFSEIQFINKIGFGAFSTVWKGKISGKYRAIKMLNNKKCKGDAAKATEQQMT